MNNYTPYEKHGKLSVKGTQLFDQNGEPFQLFGMSSYGLHRPEYLTTETFKTLRDDWNTNTIRIAIYTQKPWGYCGDNQAKQHDIAIAAIDKAVALGMYVIIDWHVLGEKSPLVFADEAAKFFGEVSERYADNKNVIYELCNEPNGEEGCWDNIYTYADRIIPIIRANNPDAIIIVGTPTWSQEVDKPVAKPLPYNNLLYSVHFYAGTHKGFLRKRVSNSLAAGLPIFVSEFNICTCTGNGDLDYNEGELWKNLIEENTLSFICWNLSNVNETSSVLKADTETVANWTTEELNTSGVWFRNWCRIKKW